MTLAVSMTAPQFSTSLAPVLEAGGFAERAGLDGLFLFDHLIPVGAPGRPVLELAATIGAVAAATGRLTVGSLVARAPLRGPAVTAALARTVEMIAPGRTVIGLGAGDRYSRPEVDRFGQVDEGLDDRIGAVAETVDELAVHRVPTWVGGTHPRILEVALRSDGWNGWGLPVDVFADKAVVLRARRPELTVSWGGSAVLGRDEDDLERILSERDGALGDVVGTPPRVADQLLRQVEAGADHLIVSILPNRIDRWELFAEEVLPKLA